MTSSEPATVPSLQGTFEAAMAFGLSDEEIWEVLKRACRELPPDATQRTAVERVIAKLAAKIVEDEKRMGNLSRP